jgi:hypothetical protein
MNKHFRYGLVVGSILNGWALLAACNEPAGSSSARQVSQASQPAPSVAEVVRHYAGLMARRTRLATPDSCQFAGVVPTRQPAGDASAEYSVSLSWKLPACEVGAFLDQQQQLVDVNIETPRPPEPAHQLSRYTPHPPATLVRLGELRRVFGPGTNASKPEEAGEYYFTYQPSPAARKLTIQAFLLDTGRTDSAVVNRIALFATPTE